VQTHRSTGPTWTDADDTHRFVFAPQGRYLMDSQTIFFALSLVALVLGPAAYQMAHLARPMMSALDGFIFVAIGGLVLLHILPESVELAGWVAVLGTAAGIWLPSLIEKRLHRLAHQVHTVTLIFGLVAVGLHAFADGLAIGTGTDHGSAAGTHSVLPIAVVLHRLPVGLTVWFLLRPLYGWRLASAALGLIAVATSAGFMAGAPVLAAIESRAWGLFQAVVAGTLLHVVLHRSYPLAAAGPVRGRRSAALGALVGIGLLWSMMAGHAQAIATGAEAFHALALESAPALLLAYVGAGLVWALMPRGTVAWMRQGSRVSQAMRGMAFGLPLPICSCGVIPVYRSLVMAGVPGTAAMAFLIATPELSLDAVLISLPLLGGELTIVRVVAAAIVALVTGWVVGRYAIPLIPTEPEPVDPQQASLSLSQRVRNGLRLGLGEVVDTTAPWILVGLALAAGAQALLGTRLSELLPSGWEVETLALLGMPAYVCASGATPLVAVLIANGVSPGAALAFLLTGPATNVTTVGVLTRLHGRRVAVLFAVVVVALAILLGRLVDGVLDLQGGIPLLSMTADHEAGWRGLCLIAVILLFVGSLVRRGPRGFVGELFDADGDDEAQGHSHNHDHEHNRGSDHESDGCGDGCCDSNCGSLTPDSLAQR
jgi:uncharacterized protein